MSSKPAYLKISLVVSALAIENGPGPQVGSSYSSGLLMMRSTICCARYIQSLSILRRQTTPPSAHPAPATCARCAVPARAR